HGLGLHIREDGLNGGPERSRLHRPVPGLNRNVHFDKKSHRFPLGIWVAGCCVTWPNDSTKDSCMPHRYGELPRFWWFWVKICLFWQRVAVRWSCFEHGQRLQWPPRSKHQLMAHVTLSARCSWEAILPAVGIPPASVSAQPIAPALTPILHTTLPPPQPTRQQLQDQFVTLEQDYQ